MHLYLGGTVLCRTLPSPRQTAVPLTPQAVSREGDAERNAFYIPRGGWPSRPRAPSLGPMQGLD